MDHQRRQVRISLLYCVVGSYTCTPGSEYSNTLPPHHRLAGISGAVFCVIAINWKSSRVVLCRFESMAVLVHGHVAIITETESTLHHDRVQLVV